MDLSRFLRRIPLWQVPILFGIGVGLIYASYLIGLGGRFYFGDILFLTGFIVYLVATLVLTLGYLHAAFMRFVGMKD